MRFLLHIALSLFLVLSLIGCNEEEVIQNLKAEGNILQGQVDSLKREIGKMESMVRNVRVIRDTVRAGEGPFHLFTRLKAQVSHGEEVCSR